MRSLTFLLLCTAVLGTMTSTALPQQPQDPVVAVVSAPTLGGKCIMSPGPVLEAQLAYLKKSTPFHQMNPFKKDSVSGKTRHSSSTEHLMSNTSTGGCIWSIYVDWLQSSGFRVMPLQWDAPKAEVLATARGVNAILFPGGVLSRATNLYKDFFGRMCDIYDLVKAENDLGNKVALWGTCEGFQMIGACAADRNVSVLWGPFAGTDGPAMMANNFTKYSASSKMLGAPGTGGISGQGAPANIVSWLNAENTTLNWHSLGIPPHMFITNPALNASGLVPLATTNDFNGKPFVSMFEMTGSRNIYGVQFHPERVMFSFSNIHIGHQDHAIQVSEYLGLFLVTKARENSNSFGSDAEVAPRLINNIVPMNTGWGIRVYYV